MNNYMQFPPQQLPMSKKTKKWRKQILDWAANRATISSSLVRNSVVHKVGIMEISDSEIIEEMSAIDSIIEILSSLKSEDLKKLQGVDLRNKQEKDDQTQI